jgi:hypothetical protein
MVTSRRIVVSALFALLLSPAPALAQQRIPVFLYPTIAKDDRIGRQVQFEIKEAIRGSHGFRLVDNEQNWPYVEVQMITASDGLISAISYSFLYDSPNIKGAGLFIMGAVQVCYPNKEQECARTFLGVLDEAVERLKRTNSELVKTLR